MFKRHIGKLYTTCAASALLCNGAVAEVSQDIGHDDSVEFEEIIVTGESFNYNKLESGNKMPMAIVDTPQSVKIITSDMLDFAGVTKFSDGYKLDAGGHANHLGSGIAYGYFRGFETGFRETFKIDGIRVPGRIELDLAPYERVEMVKGAVSTIYGQSSVAGTINAVSKKPKAEFGGSASFEAGAWDHYRAEVDVHGSLTEDERLTYRFVGSYLDEGSFLDIAYRKQYVIAPSLQYELSENTSILLQVNYQNFEYTPFTGTSAQFIGGDPNDSSNYQIPDIPRSRFTGPSWARGTRDALLTRAYIEHNFENDWTFRANFQYNNIAGLVTKGWIGAYDILPPDGGTDVYLYYDDTVDLTYSAEVNLFGDVEAFGQEHTLFFGADYTILNNVLDNYGAINLRGADTGFNIITNPDYSLLPEITSIESLFPGGDFGPDGGVLYKNDRLFHIYGFTGQALLRPTDKLTVSLGMRYSESSQKNALTCCDVDSFLTPLGDREVEVDTKALTFQGGLIYQLTENTNAYFTYGETFEPGGARGYDPNDPTGNGVDLGPQEGRTYETGVKGELFDQQLFWSLAFFNTAKTNITQTDPEHPLFSIEVGKQRSKGIEFDVQGEVMSGWDIYLSSVIMDSKYTEGELAGTASPFGPKLGLSLFSSYEFQEGPLQGFGFGGGIVYKDVPEFELGGLVYDHLFEDYTEVDVRMFYNFDEQLRFEVAATNIFDTKYYSPTFPTLIYNLNVNPGRRILAKISYSFN